MKSNLALLIAIATGLVASAAPRKELVADVTVVPQAQIAAIAANPEAPLPPIAPYEILKFSAPSYLVVRIKDGSRGGYAGGELEVKIDRASVIVRIDAALTGKSYDYFIPLGFGFYYPLEKEGPKPIVTTRWKSLKFK
jgi:hypothetical protein